MSSGSLPFSTYHRAAQLGAGTFGSVVVVYDEEGAEYALKLFIEDEDDEEEYDEDSTVNISPIDLGALREISCLRLLRADNGHANIINMHDVQPEWHQEEAAGTAGCLGMALPLFKAGSLAAAIERKTFQSYPRKVKVQLAHGILSAVAFLHDNGILHRDLKSDNVLVESCSDDNWKAVIIDFSLAKLTATNIYHTTPAVDLRNEMEAVQHTGNVATVGYTAPEVVAQQPYDEKMDVWSVGVILLELLQNQMLTSLKHSQVLAEIQTALQRLPADQPFPHVIRGLLQTDPANRLSARSALQQQLFEKFGFDVPDTRIIDIAAALPHDDDDAASVEENSSPNNSADNKSKKKKKRDPVLVRRMKKIDRILQELDSKHPMTRSAALEYSQQLFQLDDTLDDTMNNYPSQTLTDCCIAAHRFFEHDVLDLEELDAADSGHFALWNLEDYVDNEATLFMIMDYCLYPRRLTDL